MSPLDPVSQIARWLQEADDGGAPEPTAATLATVSEDGIPSTRTVLVARCDDEGLLFRTALTSLKARHLLRRPMASVHFWWPSRRRQLRVTGDVGQVDRAEAEQLWRSRPRHLQLVTTVARQEQPVADLDELRARIAAAQRSLADAEIACPEDYGAFRVRPAMVEFWSEEPDGLALRMSYERQDDGHWTVRQLVP